jgi:hypothetical protein
MNYDRFFSDAISRLWNERRYRVFADSSALRADFPGRSGTPRRVRVIS